MRFCRPIIAFALLLAATALPALAASSADLPHVHVQLISPDAQLHPGTTNNAGLYFKLEPGWHVYWKNAGDAGEPPRINWTLPAGITASPLQFPAPKRLPLGPLMDFGYENEVLFPVPGYRFCECSLRARPFSTPRSIGLFAAAVVSPRKPSLKSRVRSHRLFPPPARLFSPITTSGRASPANFHRQSQLISRSDLSPPPLASALP